MNHTDFSPKVVGIDKKTIDQLKQLYENIIYTAEALQSELDFIFDSPSGNNFSFLMEFVEATDPVKLIRQRWVSFKNINIDGVDMEVFTASNLLKIPKYEETIQLQNELKDLYSKVKTLRFYYPLEQLYNKTDNSFSIPQDFTDKLTMRFTTLTTNALQNEQLEALEQLKNALNKLCNMGIIKASGGLRIIPERFYGNILKNNHLDVDPFELNSSLFRWERLASDQKEIKKEPEEDDSEPEENDSEQEGNDPSQE